MNMSRLEYGLKTGDLTEKEIIRIFEKALNKCADESEDPCISKGRKKNEKGYQWRHMQSRCSRSA